MRLRRTFAAFLAFLIAATCYNPGSITSYAFEEIFLDEEITREPESEIPEYPDDFGILELPVEEEEADIPEAGFRESEFNESTLEDIPSDEKKANVSHYSISINPSKTTLNNFSWTYHASVPGVVTFFDPYGRLNVACPTEEGIVEVNIYDPSSMKLITTRALAMKYGKFGNITCDNDGNYYITCGQDADENDVSKVTLCISKYNNSGTKVKDLELKGNETIPYSETQWGTMVPFNSGNCDMTVNNGILAVNYARKMFSGHQSNMMIYVDCASMNRIYANTAYTSHSFDQRVYSSGNSFIALNHGDAIKRGFRISKISNFYDQVGYNYSEDDSFYNFHFREGANRSFGYNDTFAQLGGLTELNNVYVFAAASERELSLEPGPTTVYCGHNDARDLFVQIIKKDFENYSDVKDKYAVPGQTRRTTGTRPDTSATELKLDGNEVDYGILWLTEYDKNHFAANPKIFTLDGNTFGVMWEKRAYGQSQVEGTYYMLLDSKGNIVRDIRRIPETNLAAHTDPAVKDGYVYWATNDEYGTYINVLSPSDIQINKQPYVVGAIENEDGSRTAAITLEAEGAVSYKWLVGTDSMGYGEVTTPGTIGADSDALITKLSRDEDRFYICEMTDSMGYKARTEPAFHVWKMPEDIYANEGEEAKLSIDAFGAIAYVWTYSITGDYWRALEDEDIVGARTKEVTIPMTSDRFDYMYRCIMSAGGQLWYGDVVHIKRNFRITKQPENILGEMGEYYYASCEAIGEGVSYTWYMLDKYTSEKVKVDYQGANTANLQIRLDDTTDNQQFVCVLKDIYGNELESDTILVRERLNFKVVPDKITLPSKKNSTASLTTTGEKYYTGASLTWSSSDEAVVKVDDYGRVTVAAGLTEDKTATISVATDDGIYTATCEVTVTPLPFAEAPTASSESGSYKYGKKIYLNTKTLGSKIVYTLDGSAPSVDDNGNPTGSAMLYSGPVVLTEDITLKAMAVNENYRNSAVSEYKYEVVIDWGDLESDLIKAKFANVLEIPSGVWFIFGNDEDGYSKVYTESGVIDYSKDYTGKAITFDTDIHVFHGVDRLWRGSDYKITYKNNKKVATSEARKKPTITITGAGNYKNKSEFYFDIDSAEVVKEEKIPGATPASKVKVACLAQSVEFLGRDFVLDDFYKPGKSGFDKITLYTGKTKSELKEGADYSVSLINDGSKGTVNVVFTLTGNYYGKITKKVKVKAYNIAKDKKGLITETISDARARKMKRDIIPELTIFFGDKELIEGVDYSVKYKRSAKGNYAIVRGKGNYTGSRKLPFAIAKSDPSNIELTCKDRTMDYRAGNYYTQYSFTDDGDKLILGKDIELAPGTSLRYFYADTDKEIEPDAVVEQGTAIMVKATIICSEQSNYIPGTYEVRGYYKMIDPLFDISSRTNIHFERENLKYDRGREIIPEKETDIHVYFDGSELKPEDYEIISVKNNRLIGSAKITIRGVGKYGGIKTANFKIDKLKLK